MGYVLYVTGDGDEDFMTGQIGSKYGGGPYLYISKEYSDCCKEGEQSAFTKLSLIDDGNVTGVQYDDVLEIGTISRPVSSNPKDCRGK